MGRVNTRSATDVKTNAAASAALPAVTDFRWYVSHLSASVSAGSALLTITDADGTVKYNGIVTAGGPISETFDPPLDPKVGAVTATLAAAGAANIGTVFLQGYLGS